jgi:hypothetical protein
MESVVMDRISVRERLVLVMVAQLSQPSQLLEGRHVVGQGLCRKYCSVWCDDCGVDRYRKNGTKNSSDDVSLGKTLTRARGGRRVSSVRGSLRQG